MDIDVIPLGRCLGAEIRGLHLGHRMDDDTVRTVRGAWLDHLVLLFRGQNLTDQQLIAFSRSFGDLEFPPSRLLSLPSGSGQKAEIPPEINVISNVTENGKPIGQLGAGEAAWHTDSAFVERPPAGSVLYALEVPPTGGNTSFLNMYAAYDALPPDLRRRVEGGQLKHDQSYTSAGDRRAGYEALDDIRDAPGPLHPIVRFHPETGRPALYLGRRLNAYIDGMSVAANEKLLDSLWEHVLQPQFVWEHEWIAGDVLMWDNRCVMHRREAFDDTTRRIMHRTQIKGDRPA